MPVTKLIASRGALLGVLIAIMGLSTLLIAAGASIQDSENRGTLTSSQGFAFAIKPFKIDTIVGPKATDITAASTSPKKQVGQQTQIQQALQASRPIPAAQQVTKLPF